MDQTASAHRPTPGSVTLPVVLGFSAIVSQLVLLRAFLAVFQGNELLLALVFVAWFAGIFGGALSAGMLGRRWPRLARWAAVPTLAIPLAALAGVARILTVRTWLDVPAGNFLSLEQALPVLGLGVLPCSLLVGAAFPLLAAAPPLERGSDPNRLPAGWVYWLESAGSLAGGLLYTFLWAGRISMVAMLGVCLVVGALAWMAEVTVRRRFGPVWRIAGAVALLLVMAVSPVLLGRLEARLVEMYWEALAPGQRLAAWADTRYQQLAVGERDGQYAVYANGLLTGTFPDPYEVTRRVHFCLNQCLDPRAILLLGAGAEGEVQQVLEYPVRSVTLVIQDPVYLRLITPLLPEADRARLADPRLAIVHADGVGFLRESERRFDLVLLHAPPPATAAYNRFYTREFFTLVRGRLTSRGVLAVGLEAAESFMGPEMRRYTGTLYRTLEAVFPRVQVAPGTRLLFLAGGPDAAITLDADELARRLARRPMSTAGEFRAAQFRLMLLPERVGWLRETLANAPAARINTDRRPVIYLDNLRLWDLMMGGRLQGLLAVVERLTLPALLGIALAALIGAIAAGGLAFRRGRRGRAAAPALAGMWVFGFLGMGLEIILLYHFQNLYGYLYSTLGILVALFMAGLTAGAWWMDRSRHSAAADRAWAFRYLPLAALGVCGAAWILFGQRPALGVFIVFLLMGAAGLLTGLYFPLGCRIFAGRDPTPLATAAWLDAFDHLGALVGAGVTGLLFLPVLGIGRTVFFFACLALFLPVVGGVLHRAERKPGDG